MSEVDFQVVNFGKYKGKCISELLSDSNYIEWLKQQSWLEKHKNIYNIIINQNFESNNNSKTPEHNKLQNLFLSKDNQKKLINIFKLDCISHYHFYLNNFPFSKCNILFTHF